MTIYQLAGIPYLWDPSLCALVKAARRNTSPGQMSLFEGDPEFEQKHPRGQAGKFSQKGGSPLPVLEAAPRSSMTATEVASTIAASIDPEVLLEVAATWTEGEITDQIEEYQDTLADPDSSHEDREGAESYLPLYIAAADPAFRRAVDTHYEEIEAAIANRQESRDPTHRNKHPLVDKVAPVDGGWVSRALAMSPRTQAAGISDLSQRVVSRLRAHQGDPGSRDEQIGRYVRLEAGRMTREDRRAVSQFGDHWGDVEPDLTPEQRLQTAAALIVQATGGDPVGGDEIALGIAAQMSVPTAVDTAGKIAYGVGVDMTEGASRYQGTEGKDGQIWHGHLKGDKTKDEHAADQSLARMLDDAHDWDPEAMLSVLSDWARGLMEKGGSPDPVVEDSPVDQVVSEGKGIEDPGSSQSSGGGYEFGQIVTWDDTDHYGDPIPRRGFVIKEGEDSVLVERISSGSGWSNVTMPIPLGKIKGVDKNQRTPWIKSGGRQGLQELKDIVEKMEDGGALYNTVKMLAFQALGDNTKIATETLEGIDRLGKNDVLPFVKKIVSQAKEEDIDFSSWGSLRRFVDEMTERDIHWQPKKAQSKTGSEPNQESRDPTPRNKHSVDEVASTPKSKESRDPKPRKRKPTTLERKVNQLKRSYQQWIPFGRNDYQMTADSGWTISITNDSPGWVVYTSDHEPEDLDGIPDFAEEWGYELIDDTHFKTKEGAMAFAEDFAETWAEYQIENYDPTDPHQAEVHPRILERIQGSQAAQ